MVLEATLICIDNSEWSRNGDYAPSRLEAQTDTTNVICGAKTNQNPENAVGILTMAGDRVEVRVAPTPDLGQILQGLHGIEITGKADVLRAIRTAQLALRHRLNKNQKQRIVLLIGSPLDATEKQLEQVGKLLKKNNVSLDIISFGEVEENSAKLAKLHSAVNSNNSSHFLECRAEDTAFLPDLVLSSPVVLPSDESRAAGVTGGAGAAGLAAADGGASAINELGVDPIRDPDLYMALRLSLEEEKARQQRESAAKAAAAAAAADEPSGASESTGASSSSAATTQQSNAAAAPSLTVVGTTTTTTAAGGGEPSTNAAPGSPARARSAQSEASPAPALSMPAGVAEIEGFDEMDEDLRQALILSLTDYGVGSALIGDRGDQLGEGEAFQQDTADKDVTMTDSGDGVTVVNAAITPPSQAAGHSALEGSAAGARTTSVEVAHGGESFGIRADGGEAPTASGERFATGDTGAAGVSGGTVVTDPEIIKQLLQGLPGVNIDDPKIQEALRQLAGKKGGSKEGNEKKTTSDDADADKAQKK